MKKGNQTNIRKIIIEYSKTVIFAIILAMILTKYIVSNANVPTGSMNDTIETGAYCIVNRTAYWFKEPERKDIVVFNHPDGDDILLVKRIIGLPGDTVEITDGKLYINGEYLDESNYLYSEMTFDCGPYIVPEGQYFMLGDNRRYSLDARYWENTYVKREDIIAKAMFQYIPSFKLLSKKW